MAEAEEVVDFEGSDNDMEQEEEQKRSVPSKTKGRGHRGETSSHLKGKGGGFDSVKGDSKSMKSGAPARSEEGWVLFITGVHEEAVEDDVLDKFQDYGDVKNIQVNLDRRSGFLKGYVLVEYQTFKEAQKAKEETDGSAILGKQIAVDWAFKQGGSKKGGKSRR